MSVFKRSLSPTRRDVPSYSGWKSRIQPDGNRRAQVERATGSPPGSLEGDGVNQGGFSDVPVSRIAAEDSGVPTRGLNRVYLGSSKRGAPETFGRVPVKPRGTGK